MLSNKNVAIICHFYAIIIAKMWGDHFDYRRWYKTDKWFKRWKVEVYW